MTLAFVAILVVLLVAAAACLAWTSRSARNSYARRIRQHRAHDSKESPAASRADTHTVDRPDSWDPFRPRRRRAPGNEAAYRSRLGTADRSEHWDPYADEQSRARRLREARHKTGSSRLPDYYALLEVEEGATHPQIERAYRRLVAQCHPDRFQNDPDSRRQAEERLKELNAAMRVLRDPVRRAQYDAQR